MTGIKLISKERWEQVYLHGYDLSHDSGHDKGELAKNAALLAVHHTDAYVVENMEDMQDDFELLEHIDSLPETELEKKIHRLKVAGALIAAEIDRLQNNQP